MRALALPGSALLVTIAIAVVTLGLLTGDLSFIRRSGGSGAGPAKTPTPSNVVVVDPRSQVPGSIVYVKAGNIWAQSGTSARQLTHTGADAMPTWVPDGSLIYYVSSQAKEGRMLYQGSPRGYALTVPSLVRVRADGSTAAEPVLAGLYASGSYSWSYYLRQPAVSPDGSQIAVLSDGPDPTKSDVVLQLIATATGKLTSLNLLETSPLGHQDPAWRPDGAVLAYVRSGRDGNRGASVIWRYDVKTKKASAMTGSGYLQPSWSPDGLFMAATRSDSFGTDIVVLDAANGAELLRVTSDGRSFAPAWSPAGNAIVFLHVEGGVVDLVEVAVQRVGATWAPGEQLALTEAAGLDAGSRPSWFIPAAQLPKPPATAAPTVPPAATTPSPKPTATPKGTR